MTSRRKLSSELDQVFALFGGWSRLDAAPWSTRDAGSHPGAARSYDRNPAEMESTFLEKLSNDLLAELKRGLSGEHGGTEAIRQALAIRSAADEVTRELQRLQQTTPPAPG